MNSLQVIAHVQLMAPGFCAGRKAKSLGDSIEKVRIVDGGQAF
jgi:hypothetical protein